MQAQRHAVISVKKHLIANQVQGQELDIQTRLCRLKTFKEVCLQSGWYYGLIERTIEADIHMKPLVRFMAGKPPLTLQTKSNSC
jgi:tRNA G37 N-methylase TrmD